LETTTQIRYNDGGAVSNIKSGFNGNIDVEFFANVKGVAPGQSAVFYEGDDVVGGGIIMGSYLN
jgi:tRNA-uridine 2-sulfurtransferase